jgi:hypothetical protein
MTTINSKNIKPIIKSDKALKGFVDENFGLDEENDYYPGEINLDGKCPDCGGNLKVEYFADPIDYHRMWTCLGCGNTFDE